MLKLTRRIGETIQIGNDIIIEVTAIRGRQVQLAINAPKDVSILRDDAKKLFKGDGHY